MTTTRELIQEYSVEVFDHLDLDFDVPVLQGIQRQGDVLVRPTVEKNEVIGVTAASFGLLDPDYPTDGAVFKFSEEWQVPADGVPVVRGENGGNTHLLLAEGDVRYQSLARGLDLGRFQVAEGATAWLAHPEHGYMGIGPGTYRVSRQREMTQAQVQRIVAD